MNNTIKNYIKRYHSIMWERIKNDNHLPPRTAFEQHSIKGYLGNLNVNISHNSVDDVLFKCDDNLIAKITRRYSSRKVCLTYRELKPSLEFFNAWLLKKIFPAKIYGEFLFFYFLVFLKKIIFLDFSQIFLCWHFLPFYHFFIFSLQFFIKFFLLQFLRAWLLLFCVCCYFDIFLLLFTLFDILTA